MDSLASLLSTLWDLARALFDAFGGAVARYPLVTLLCVAAGAWAYLSRRDRPGSIRRRGFLAATDAMDWLEIVAIFIVVTIVASGAGFVVHGIIDLSIWMTGRTVALLGFGAGVGAEVVRPFADAPLAFLVALAVSAVVATALGMRAPGARGGAGATGLARRARAAWRLPRGLAAAAICLFVTYVAATVAASLDAPAPAPASSGGGDDA